MKRYPKQSSVLKYLKNEYYFMADQLHNAIKHGEDITHFLPYMTSSASGLCVKNRKR